MAVIGTTSLFRRFYKTKPGAYRRNLYEKALGRIRRDTRETSLSTPWSSHTLVSGVIVNVDLIRTESQVCERERLDTTNRNETIDITTGLVDGSLFFHKVSERDRRRGGQKFEHRLIVRVDRLAFEVAQRAVIQPPHTPHEVTRSRRFGSHQNSRFLFTWKNGRLVAHDISSLSTRFRT